MKQRTRHINVLYCSGFQQHRMHRELVRQAAELGWLLNALPYEDTDDGTYTGGLPVDAIISHVPPGKTKSLTRNFPRVPHVTLNARAAADLQLPGAVLNHAAAGRLVAEHFMEAGFTAFAAFAHLDVDYAFDDRLAGFAEAVRDAGHSEPQRVTLSDSARLHFGRTLAFLSEALTAMPRPLAIMAANDRVAVNIMHACRQQDLSIPAQIAICGFGDEPVTCDLAPIPLSSVATDVEAQAREAANLLSALLHGERSCQDPVFIEPKGLVVRRSSGVPAHEDATVAKALGYIHEHAYAADLSIREVVGHIGVSRTALFEVFKRDVHVTPLHYINTLRIAEAQRLLRETGMMIKDIQTRCGFSSYYQMYQAFKRTTGRSPGSLRTATAPKES